MSAETGEVQSGSADARSCGDFRKRRGRLGREELYGCSFDRGSAVKTYCLHVRQIRIKRRVAVKGWLALPTPVYGGRRTRQMYWTLRAIAESHARGVIFISTRSRAIRIGA